MLSLVLCLDFPHLLCHLGEQYLARYTMYHCV